MMAAGEQIVVESGITPTIDSRKWPGFATSSGPLEDAPYFLRRPKPSGGAVTGTRYLSVSADRGYPQAADSIGQLTCEVNRTSHVLATLVKCKR